MSSEPAKALSEIQNQTAQIQILILHHTKSAAVKQVDKKHRIKMPSVVKLSDRFEVSDRTAACNNYGVVLTRRCWYNTVA